MNRYSSKSLVMLKRCAIDIVDLIPKAEKDLLAQLHITLLISIIFNIADYRQEVYNHKTKDKIIPLYHGSIRIGTDRTLIIETKHYIMKFKENGERIG